LAVENADSGTEELKVLNIKRLVSFPFLPNVYTDAIAINKEACIEAFLFNNPQKIEIENIFCSKGFGYMQWEILTKQISISEKEQLYYIFLEKPVDVVTWFLGVFKLTVLGVDGTGKLVTFVREDEE